MTALLLMGVGSNNWLAYLWVLMGFAAIVQFVDWLVRLVKDRKRRKQEELEFALHDLFSDGEGDNGDMNEIIGG